MRYVYLGDAYTRPELRGAPCDPVSGPSRSKTGRGRVVVIRGRNRNQLVRFADGTQVVVAGRFLRLSTPPEGAPR